MQPKIDNFIQKMFMCPLIRFKPNTRHVFDLRQDRPVIQITTFIYIWKLCLICIPFWEIPFFVKLLLADFELVQWDKIFAFEKVLVLVLQCQKFVNGQVRV